MNPKQTQNIFPIDASLKRVSVKSIITFLDIVTAARDVSPRVPALTFLPRFVTYSNIVQAKLALLSNSLLRSRACQCLADGKRLNGGDGAFSFR
jgi:hypothetical protein